MTDSFHKGKSIRMYLVDGTPQGVLTAEIMNWTGHVVAGPRTKLAELVQRSELSRTGIYFLTGPDPETGKTLVYIGESDNVGKRLVQHNKDQTKEFWDKASIITSKDQNLTKAHARYLESRLIAIAQETGRAKVHNATGPDYGFLPEADIADMEYFISQIRLVLPVLGLEFLREKPKVRLHGNIDAARSERTKIQDDSPVFIAQSRKHGLKAEAQEIEGDFIVLAGSEAQPEWIGIEGHSYYQLHKNLIADGTLTVNADGKKAVFKEDTSFKSPSAASAIVFGRASNGRTDWKVKGANKTYADWQDEQIEKATKAA